MHKNSYVNTFTFQLYYNTMLNVVVNIELYILNRRIHCQRMHHYYSYYGMMPYK